jgi:hypothetical protein
LFYLKKEGKVKYLSVKLILPFAMLGLASCMPMPHVQEVVLPNLNIPARNINTYIKLTDPKSLANSHRNKDTLTLQLTNLSSNDVIFSGRPCVRVAAEDGDSWSHIDDNFSNNRETFVLPTMESAPQGQLVSVIPFVPNLTSPREVRVVIIGHIAGTAGEEAGAYLDVTINP